MLVFVKEGVLLTKMLLEIDFKLVQLFCKNQFPAVSGFFAETR